MNSIPVRDKAEEDRKIRNRNARCIACGRKCSMSGICMMHWPGFPVPGRKQAGGSGEDKPVDGRVA